MRPFLSWCLLLGLGCQPDIAPPNIVLIYVDDLGWRDLGFMGSDYYETPNIDRLAESGMVFTNAYANAPNCAPSRAALMSGMYGPRTGVYTVGSAARGQSTNRRLQPVENRTDLDTSFVTIAEALGSVGYTNGHVGKWHLGGVGSLPTDQGFHVNIAGDAGGSPPGYFHPYIRNQRDIGLADRGEDGEYLTDRLTAEAIAFVEEHQEGPFFLYMSHYAVHTPIQARADLIEAFADRPGSNGQDNPTYAAMIASVDEGVGQLLGALDSLNLADNTVVIFYADNGGFGPVTSMAPLRGSKGMLYEGGIREPLVVHWPGVTSSGSTVDVPVIGTDLYPTLLEIAGAPLGDDPRLDGVSLVPVLRNTDVIDDRPLFWHFPAYLQGDASSDGPWRTTPASAIRLGSFKLIEFFETGTVELYDLNNDVGEKNNLALTLPGRAQTLHALLDAWRVETNAFVPTKLNPEYRAPR